MTKTLKTIVTLSLAIALVLGIVPVASAATSPIGMRTEHNRCDDTTTYRTEGDFVIADHVLLGYDLNLNNVYVDDVLIGYNGIGGDVTIPSNVEYLKNTAFSGNTDITSITINDDVWFLDEGCFRDCTNLQKATFSDNVYWNKGYTFYNCSSLTEVKTPSNKAATNDHMYAGCTSLREISINYAMGTDTFAGCHDLTVHLTSNATAAREMSEKAAKACNIKLVDANGKVIYDPTPKSVETPVNTPVKMEVADIPADGIAYQSTQKVSINGADFTFDCYALKDANGYLTNYIRIKDLGSKMNFTNARFNVTWENGMVTIAKGTLFNAWDEVTSLGGTAKSVKLSAAPFSGNQPYKASNTATMIDGVATPITAIVLTDSNGGGYTYYRLRDIGIGLGFNVGWTAERGMFIETDKPYTNAD